MCMLCVVVYVCVCVYKSHMCARTILTGTEAHQLIHIHRGVYSEVQECFLTGTELTNFHIYIHWGVYSEVRECFLTGTELTNFHIHIQQGVYSKVRE